MPINYDRRIDLSISGVNITPSGLAAGSLRVRAQIQSSTVSSPNACQLVITNLSDDTAKRLLNEYGPVTLSVGYVDGVYGQIFKGTVTQVIHGEREQGTDKLTQVFCYDGDQPHNVSTVSTTLPSGWTPQNALDTLVKAMVPQGLNPTPRVLGLDLSQPRGIGPLVLSGAVKDHMRDLASSLNAMWFVQGGEGVLAAKDAPLSSEIIKVNSETGMLFQPRQTSSGIYVTTLINPRIQIRSQIQVDQSSIIRSQQDTNSLSKTSATSNALLNTQGLGDGVYTVLHTEVDFDSIGNAWYQYHTCIGSNTGVLSKEQSNYLGHS